MAMAMQVALLTRWEWFKLQRRWVLWILLGFLVAISQLIFWLVAILGDDVSYESTAQNIANGLEFASLLIPFIAVILAAAVTGGEYGWGTLRPVLSMGPGRWPFLTSKVAVVLLATAGVLLILSVALAISSFIAEIVLTHPESAGSGAISWLGVLALYARMVYGSLVFIVVALFFVVLTGSNGFGMSLSMGYYIADAYVVPPILGGFDWAGWAFAFMSGTNLTAWTTTDALSFTDADTITIGGISDMAHGFILITIYIAVLGAAAIALFLRRDIAGAKGG